MIKQKNIHPIFNQTLSKSDKEKFLNQKSKVIWLTGLSGSGKSTIAIELEKKLQEKGILTQLLDGDNVRSGINNNLGFSDEDRLENIRRIAEVSKLFLNCGLVTINSFVSPTEDLRTLARDIIGDENFFQVYIKASVEACEKRDVKGLYAKARRGEIKDFTGISAPFDVPVNCQLVVDTEKLSIEESVQHILANILPIIKY